MKKSDLIGACENVFGIYFIAHLCEMGVELPEIVKIAANKAFMEDMKGISIATIREALINLTKQGGFNFEEEDEK